jgi:hypothetical protein
MADSLPNFFILGAAKSGTTSLYAYLRQHPAVFMPEVKEPRYFAYVDEPPEMKGPGDEDANERAVFTFDAYRALFADVADETAVGEASPNYLYSETAPCRIHERLPKAQLFVVLRDPVERAYSHYLHLRGSGREPLDSFTEALEKEDERRRKGWEWSWHYREMGFYHHQLQRYLDRFDREQLTVYLFEDFVEDNLAVTRDIFRRLGVDDSFEPNTSLRYRTTGEPLSDRFQQFLYNPDNVLRRLSRYVLPKSVRDRWLIILKNANLQKPLLPTEVRERLIETYRPDILRLQDLIDRDLSDWLTP